LVERAKELVGYIEANAEESLRRLFEDGDKGLENILLQKCALPRVMSKHLVFPED
jgi:hypothetical protein